MKEVLWSAQFHNKENWISVNLSMVSKVIDLESPRTGIKTQAVQ